MESIDEILDDIIPEKITECTFDEMVFTNDMLEIYFLIDGKKSITQIGEQLPVDLSEIIVNLKKMARGGIVKIRKPKRYEIKVKG